MRIVLVDDDQLVADALAFALRDAGHDVWHGTRPEPAMARLQTEGADLVVSDVRLEGADGTAFIRQVRAGFPHYPIIAISGGGGHLEEARAAGANLCLQKPFTGRALLAAISDIMAGRNA
jgi:DNA-binding response OmpR family regulator